jgi:hypothetical protein
MSPSHGHESGPKLGILYVPGLMMRLAGHSGSWRVLYPLKNLVDRTPFILKQVQFPTFLERMFHLFSIRHMHVPRVPNHPIPSTCHMARIKRVEYVGQKQPRAPGRKRDFPDNRLNMVASRFWSACKK